MQKDKQEAPQNKVAQDGLFNVVSGLGGANDKTEYNQWLFKYNHSLADFNQFEIMYNENWIVSNLINCLTDDTLAKGRILKTKYAEELTAYQKKICYTSKIKEALKWSLLYGGSGILLLTGQDLEKPFDINKVKKDVLLSPIGNLRVFDRTFLFTSQINSTNLLSDNYLEAEYYTLQDGHNRIHYSHIVKFKGREVPLRHKHYLHGWGYSILPPILESVNGFLAANKGIYSLMQEAHIDVLRAEGLHDRLANGEDEAIIKRYSGLNMMKSMINAIVLDKEEDFERKTINLSGVAQTIEQFMVIISAASGVPVTKLFGKTASGLNATGEGDMKIYYDKLMGIQASVLDPALYILDQVLCMSCLGKIPDDFDYVWTTLHQTNELEAAQVRALDSETYLRYFEAGLIPASAILKELQQDEVIQIDEEELQKIKDSFSTISEKLEMQERLDELEVEQAEADLDQTLNSDNNEESDKPKTKKSDQEYEKSLRSKGKLQNPKQLGSGNIETGTGEKNQTVKRIKKSQSQKKQNQK